MNQDLKIIKKKYGEKMMHLCRELFATILDNSPGTLSQILLQNFEPNHLLYDDLENHYYIPVFKDYIYSIYDNLALRQNDNQVIVADPVTLMKQAGYTLYECTTEEEIQKFKKYYAPREELCTFRGGRLQYCYVYFAVKDNVNEINRSDFPNPDRQDEYGTSVISIQFTRGDSHTLSIKNRYNHAVSNPDATFSNNLDEIIPGLTKSFADYYGMTQENQQKAHFHPNEYVRANDGKFYRYLYEIDNIYYCLNNVIIDNFQVIRLPKEKYLLADYFIIDLVNKKLTSRVNDSFPETLGKIKNITITNDGDDKKVTITPEIGEDIILVLDKYGYIKSLTNNNLEIVPDTFLYYSLKVNNITLDNAKEIGNEFLYTNKELINISLPKVTIIGNDCLCRCINTEEVNFPLLEQVGDNFMMCNIHLHSLELPNCKIIGNNVLKGNMGLERLVLPKVITIGNYFIGGLNGELQTINLPEVKTLGNNVFTNCFNVSKVSLPKVLTIGDNFLSGNLIITEINLPQVEVIGNACLSRGEKIKEIILPNCKIIGHSCFFHNNSLKKLVMPKVTKIGDYSFGALNEELETINLPEVEILATGVFYQCLNVSKVSLPKVKEIGNYFLENNQEITEVNLPQVEVIGDDFLVRGKKVKEVILPNVKRVGLNFLTYAYDLETLYVPNIEFDATIGSIFLRERIETLNKRKKLTK